MIFLVVTLLHLGAAPVFGPLHTTQDLFNAANTQRWQEAISSLGAEGGEIRAFGYTQIPTHLDAMTEWYGGRIHVLQDVRIPTGEYGWFIDETRFVVYVPNQCGNVSVVWRHAPTPVRRAVPVAAVVAAPANTPDVSPTPVLELTPSPTDAVSHRCRICWGLILLPLLFVHGGQSQSTTPTVSSRPSSVPSPSPSPSLSPSPSPSPTKTPCPTPTPTKTPCPTSTPKP